MQFRSLIILTGIILLLFIIYLVMRSRHDKQKKKLDYRRRFRGK
jgi:cytochrome c oxidase assembly factor CtaG